MTQLRQQNQRLQELDIRVKIISFDDDPLALAYVEKSRLEWPLLLDSDRKLYRAYGLTRGSGWQLYGPASSWNYLKLLAAGHTPGRPGKDWKQLGGDVLINPNGIIRLIHLSTGPHDRPPVQLITDTVLNYMAEHSR